MRSVPHLARFTPIEMGYVLKAGSRFLATADLVGDLWRVQALDGTPFTLVPLQDEDGTELVLFDTALNVVASVRRAGTSMPQSLRLCGPEDETVGVLRADSVGGFHALAPDGSVLFFAGRSSSSTTTIDMLLTDAGMARPLVILFVFVLAMETEKIGSASPGTKR